MIHILMKRSHLFVSLALAVSVFAGCTGPLYHWEAHTRSTPRPPSFDPAVALTGNPVAVLGTVTPAALRGFSQEATSALDRALAKTSPPIAALPGHQSLSRLNSKGLATEYTQMMADYERSGILDRPRLQSVGSALDVKYVFLPGLADFSKTLSDRLDLVGWKVVRSRASSLRLSLQLWEIETGEIIWQSAGEATLTSELVGEVPVPMVDALRTLWAGMLQDLLKGKIASHYSEIDKLLDIEVDKLLGQ